MRTRLLTILQSGRIADATAVCVLFCRLAVCFGQQALPEDMHTCALASIEYVYTEKFKQAEEEAKKIVDINPEHPAGYFFLAVAIDSWMMYYQSSKREEEFYRCCDRAIDNGERLLSKDPNNAWVKFFMGGADGYKGTYESRYERWITSFRHGWKGVSTLMDLSKTNPDIHDINFGVGTYHYWRSALTKMLWWMPGVGNKCEEGIKEIYDAKNFGIYTKIASAVSLIAILTNEKRYEEAAKICDEMLAKYPTTLVFCWGKARALFGMERYEDAEQAYQYILSRVESEAIDNHYNAALCHLWLAKTYLKMKRYTQSTAECNRMNYYNFDNEIKKRLDKYFSEANSIKDQAKAASLKKQEAEFTP
jgi:tetratricopeptide (TPR) repeat protein